MSDFLDIKIETENWKLQLNNDGTINCLDVKRANGWRSIDFRTEEFSGIRWYGEWDGKKHSIVMRLQECIGAQKYEDKCKNNEVSFVGEDGDLSFSLHYKNIDGKLAVVASVKNMGRTPVQPVKCGLKMGIDSYMEAFPDWNRKYFPTMMRCEKTHFWGYCMSPDGDILGIASPDAVASWSLDYNTDYGIAPYIWGGHRVETLNLDLINALPLPERHPQHLYQLMPEEEKSWTIYLISIDNLNDVQAVLAPLCKAPMISIDRTTVAKGELSNIKIYSEEPIKVKAISPDGCEDKLALKDVKELTQGVYGTSFNSERKEGIYTLLFENVSGKCSEALISIRKPWSWIMKEARKAALKYPPRATSHCESWYGLYTLYLSEIYFHDEEMLQKTENIFKRIYPLMFDEKKHEPIVIKYRIQNTAAMINILADRYKSTGDIEALRKAAGLTDWIINCCQTQDGSYRAGKTHYTCVIYPAKNIIELMLIEKQLGKNDGNWMKRYEKHYNSVKAAIDELVRADGNIDTEGQLTYEDGMISCCAAQIGLFALLQEDIKEREKYENAALKILNGHRCLTNLIIPDGRQRGATRRFWESQYDVAMQPNMMNSPHGWTSWRTYATWYAYLLTGDEDYLIQTMNALGSCVQVIDSESGKLRWAFVPDPYVRARQICKQMKVGDPENYHEGDFHTLMHPYREFVLGERYVDMISDWHEVNLQDNDVHEHFKCMEEVALTKAYIIERENGEILCWNCFAEEKHGIIYVKCMEDIVSHLHVNLKQKHNIKICFGDAQSKKEVEGCFEGIQWINK